MENQVRELLQDLAGDIPPQREVPPTLRPRARRRIAATAGMTALIVGALLLGGVVAARSITASSGGPANHGPSIEPAPVGAGEVLIGGSRILAAHDPDSGEGRTIVDGLSLPQRFESITGAAWSPDRRWVAFRAGGLWVADTAGDAPRQLTKDQGWSPWAWSPSRDQLAVVQGHDVTLVDVATGSQTDLGRTVGAEDGEGYAVHVLAWSPDGSRLTYDGGPGWGSVYSIDLSSGEHSVLVRRPAGAGAIADIDWSPDGAHLAITYDDAAYIASHEADPLRYKAKVLFLANADGTDLRLVDHMLASQWPVWIPGSSVGTAWSPDGTRVAFTTFSGADSQELQVWTASVDGSAPSMVATTCCVSDGGSPVWSPDGSRIAFEAEHGGGTSSQYDDHLVVNADGTGEPTEIGELVARSWDGGWFFCRCYG